MAGEPHLIRAYGDRRDDGVIQLSFTLPVPLSEKAKEAARQFCTQLGLHGREGRRGRAGGGQLHASSSSTRGADVSLDYARSTCRRSSSRSSGSTSSTSSSRTQLGRRVVVLGACTGTDTHTVGIDAILNMKGFAGDYGLERYPWFEALQPGRQVPNEELIRRAEEKKADAILVSQVVTQRDVHKDNCAAVHRRGEGARASRARRILLLGGPRVDHKLALELGFDAGFGPGTKPSDVANYIVHALLKKMGKEPEDMHYEGEPTVKASARCSRLRMSSHDAHYGGNLVDGARMLGALRRRGHRAAASSTTATRGCSGPTTRWSSSPRCYAGDFIEAEGEIIEVGNTSRKMRFEARKVIRPVPGRLRLRGRGARAANRRLPRDRDLRRAAGQAAGEAVSAPPPYVITAAMVGAETTREQTPHLPITAEEIAEDAARCREAGAAMVHLHVRRPDGTPSQDAELFRAAIRAIRAALRRAHPDLHRRRGGDERRRALRAADPDRRRPTGHGHPHHRHGELRRRRVLEPAAAGDATSPGASGRMGIRPEIECFDAGMVDEAECAREGRAWSTSRRTTTSCSACPARWARSEPALDFLIGSVPPGSTWTVAGVGRHQLPMAELAAVKGGNARVGLEDNIFLSKGVLAKGNWELVAEAAKRARATGPGDRDAAAGARAAPARVNGGSGFCRPAGLQWDRFQGSAAIAPILSAQSPASRCASAGSMCGPTCSARAPAATTRARWRASHPSCAPARSAPAGRGRAPSSSGPRRGPGPCARPRPAAPGPASAAGPSAMARGTRRRSAAPATAGGGRA